MPQTFDFSDLRNRDLVVVINFSKRISASQSGKIGYIPSLFYMKKAIETSIF